MNSNASDSGNVTDIEGEGIDAFVNSDDTYPGMPVYQNREREIPRAKARGMRASQFFVDIKPLLS